MGMVATSQRCATEAGIEILRAGGNAADSAVAAAAALAVTEPCSTGLGGDCFALYYSSRTREITALNGSGRSPAALTLDRVKEWPPYHANTVTVPGTCAGWCDLVTAHGSKSLEDVLAPAIRLAEVGFRVGPVTARQWSQGQDRLTSPELRLTGENFRNPALARALQFIAGGGDFYRGPIAESMVRAVRERGGVMTLEDLAAHRSTWDAPISTVYRGHRIWECPPNGQGIVALLALNVLERCEPTAHAMVESLRIAFAEARRHVADPEFGEVPVARLLAEASERRIGETAGRGGSDGGSDTVYLCVVDRWGDACSFINSNYEGFGTGIVPEGWGFPLHNRGALFSLVPGHPNALAPRKRPYHTIMPGMITRADGSLYAPFGVMGGFMQPQGHVQVVVAVLDHGLDPQAALDRPRFRIEEDGRVSVEGGFPAEDLRRRGHDVFEADASRFGRGQIIRRDPDGTLVGGSDPRADGCVTKQPG